MTNIKSFVFNPFEVNTYIAYDETNECVVIDASCYQPDDFKILDTYISSHSLKPVAVLNTHGHVDHLTGTKTVCSEYSIGLFMHKADKFLLDFAQEQGRTFGMSIERPPQPESWLNDGEIFSFGNSELQLFHTPGHSPGSLVFYCAKAKFLVTGDVLFAGSIGRTDLPGGNYEQLISSIKSRILVLPADTRVLPGHGTETTIAREIKSNPFLNRSF